MTKASSFDLSAMLLCEPEGSSFVPLIIFGPSINTVPRPALHYMW